VREPSYRWDAGDYARHSTAQAEWARELIEKLALHGEESVLDIGSGDGKVTAALATRLPRGSVMGIDSSPDMVAAARRAFPPQNHANLSFAVMNALELDFEDRFDVIFSNATLHWVHDHPRVLHGVRRALKPGGRLLFQMGGRGNARQILGVIERLALCAPWAEYLRDFPCPYGFYGPEEYGPWLAAAGLEARRLELLPKEMRQQGREGLAGWVRTTWLPYTERIPPDLREAFVSEVVERYLLDHPPDDEGVVRVAMVRLEVEAVRSFPA
jgi:trans-aconitate 2-methyltransferase